MTHQNPVFLDIGECQIIPAVGRPHRRHTFAIIHDTPFLAECTTPSSRGAIDLVNCNERGRRMPAFLRTLSGPCVHLLFEQWFLSPKRNARPENNTALGSARNLPISNRKGMDLN